MQLLQCTASLPGGSGQWDCCNRLHHCLGAVGSATPAIHCLTAWGQWAVELLQYIASLPGGSGQWDSCNAPPLCPEAVGGATRAIHCLTAWGQWAVELLQCTASVPGGSGQWNSCNILPHCLGAVGSATPAIHCFTAWGQWAGELLQCNAISKNAAAVQELEQYIMELNVEPVTSGLCHCSLTMAMLLLIGVHRSTIVATACIPLAYGCVLFGPNIVWFAAMLRVVMLLVLLHG